MGTVAPSNEKQALADEIGQARALVERGEHEAALDGLEAAREIAQAQHDVDGLDEVRMLAQRVSDRAVRKNDRDRADDLAQRARADLTSGPKRSPLLLMALVWTVLVLIVWGLLSAAWGEDCSADSFLCFTRTEVFVLLLPYALPIWLVGLLVAFAIGPLFWRGRPRRHPLPRRGR